MGITSSKNSASLKAEEGATDSPAVQKQEHAPANESDEEENDDKCSDGANHLLLDMFDEEPFPKNTRAPLSWRGDPKETLSDWTIVIHHNDEEKVYHAHKNILALGERGCDYFATLFQSTFSEKDNSTSHIPLKQTSFQVFEMFLDFVYGVKIRLRRDEVLPLRSLARYFGCQELNNRIIKFLEKDLKVKTGLYYYKISAEFEEQCLHLSALKVCSEHFFELNVAELHTLPLCLFQTLVTYPELGFCPLYHKPHLHRCQCDLQLSNIVADYLKMEQEDRGHDVTVKVLVDMTGPTWMKRVDKQAASYFLQLAQSLEQDTATEEEHCKLRNLCIRCWQSAPNHVNLSDAKEYLQQHWDFLDWQGRMLLIQLGHNLQEAQEDAVQYHGECMDVQDELKSLQRSKRRLEKECKVLRRSKRRFERRYVFCMLCKYDDDCRTECLCMFWFVKSATRRDYG